jgi:hypothetical protein
MDVDFFRNTFEAGVDAFIDIDVRASPTLTAFQGTRDWQFQKISE